MWRRGSQGVFRPVPVHTGHQPRGATGRAALPPRFPGKSNQVPAGLINPVRALSRIQPLLRVSMGEVYGVRLRGHMRVPGCRPWARTGSATSRRALLSGRPARRAPQLLGVTPFAWGSSGLAPTEDSVPEPALHDVIDTRNACSRHASSRSKVYGRPFAGPCRGRRTRPRALNQPRDRHGRASPDHPSFGGVRKYLFDPHRTQCRRATPVLKRD
jgi:hypothetical protein